MDQAAQHVATTDPLRRWCCCRPGLEGGRLQVQSTMRPLVVVVADVAPEHSVEMALGQDQGAVETLSPHRAHESSREGVARGARTGVRITVASSVLKTSSKDLVNFESRSRTRYRTLSSSPAMARFRPCCVTHAESGCAVTPARCTRLEPSSMKNSPYSVNGARTPLRPLTRASVPSRAVLSWRLTCCEWSGRWSTPRSTGSSGTPRGASAPGDGHRGSRLDRAGYRGAA